ncbi:hypothetical protein DUI87_26460 [Hirundo rustica rustica]|uniref:RNase H type-1 domain-containing protein n=1 Tax=Hirundo rustica rustica TaxID=333673 RepID=A0A3M0JDK3_HIRRU|nr:hypothetical protein DUI87_26460 [Hirundo rustica rustica]
MEIKAPFQGLRLTPLYEAPLKEKRREEKRREEKREKRREEKREEKRREEKRREEKREREERKKRLSSSWSSQVCELYALYQVLELLKDKVETLFTDSKYAFGIVHTIRKIWQERGKGKELRESKESVHEKTQKATSGGKTRLTPTLAMKKMQIPTVGGNPKGWWNGRHLWVIQVAALDAAKLPDPSWKEMNSHLSQPHHGIHGFSLGQEVTAGNHLHPVETWERREKGPMELCPSPVGNQIEISQDPVHTGLEAERNAGIGWKPLDKLRYIKSHRHEVGMYVLVLGSNLLQRDLQVKLEIGVIPEDGKMTVKVLKLGQEDEEKINKKVWAGEGNRGGLNIDPISVTIEREGCPIRVRQYPISLEGREGLKPVIEGLIKDGTLELCMSPHNTPILPVKKPDGSYRLVQVLREVNKRTRSRYPVVPNPYTLLSKVPPQHQWFSVVDLKDAFGACPLAKESRDIFAFEWEDPKTGRKQQLR